MAKARSRVRSSSLSRAKTRRNQVSKPLMVRLDSESRSYLIRAAALRRISVSDYVRTVTLAQARREVKAAQEQAIVLTPDEQLAFWNALNEPPRLTPSQRQLGTLMRGEM